jgi:hypothetical protein
MNDCLISRIALVALILALLGPGLQAAEKLYLVQNGLARPEVRLYHQGHTRRNLQLAFARREAIRLLAEITATPYDGNQYGRADWVLHLGLGGDGPRSAEACNRILAEAGQTPESLGSEGFLIAWTGDGLVVTGYSEYAVLQGVYRLIAESTGFRFVRPEIGAQPVRPVRNAPVTLDLPYALRPAFALRGRGAANQILRYATPPEQTLDWVVRSGHNVYAGGQTAYEMLSQEFDLRSMSGILSGHSFNRWIPPERYGETHPEFFPLIGGKRVIKVRDAQLAVGTPALLDEIETNMLDFLERNPEVTVLPFGSNDASQSTPNFGWGEEPADTALDSPKDLPPEGSGKLPKSYSTRYIRTANELAERITAKHPNVRLHVYAYHYSGIRPPDCEVHPALIVEFCNYYRCYGHPLNDPNCPRNRMFARWLRGWSEKTKSIYIREYYQQFGRAGNYLPPTDLHTLQADIAFYRELGLLGVVPEVLSDDPNLREEIGRASCRERV